MSEAGAVVKLSSCRQLRPRPFPAVARASREPGVRHADTTSATRAATGAQERHTFSHSLTHPPTNPCPFFPSSCMSQHAGRPDLGIATL